MTRSLRVRPAGGRLEPDAGSATVELAAAIPLLVAVTLAMVGVIGVARDQVLIRPSGKDRRGGRRTQPRPSRGEPAGEVAVRRAAGRRQRHRRRRPRTRTTPGPLRQPMRPTAHLAVRRLPLTGEGPSIPPPGEKGGTTLIGLALAGFVLVAGLAAVDIGALAASRAALQTAADMAALAALTPEVPAPSQQSETSAARAEGPEVRAAELAAANEAELVACECSAVEAVVTVRRRQALVPDGLVVTLTAKARAVLGQPREPVRATVRGGDS